MCADASEDQDTHNTEPGINPSSQPIVNNPFLNWEITHETYWLDHVSNSGSGVAISQVRSSTIWMCSTPWNSVHNTITPNRNIRYPYIHFNIASQDSPPEKTSKSHSPLLYTIPPPIIHAVYDRGAAAGASVPVAAPGTAGGGRNIGR